jgi:hypothetical protein
MTGWSAVHAFAPLPALYVILATGALALALRRWYDPVPPRILLLFLAYVAVLLAPVLAGDAVLLPLDNLRLHPPYESLAPSNPRGVALQRDLVHQIAPWALEVKREVAAGRWPLWTSRQGAGTPLLADPQAQAFQPLVALAYPFSICTAAGVTAAFKVLAALLFMFLLLRRQGLGEAPAAAGATAFGLCGFVLLWLGWPLATAAALLPAVLYAVVRCDQVGGRRDHLLLTLAAAALLLSGHPETLLYEAVFAGLFLLDRCRARGWRRGGLALLGRGAAAAALAAALVAPVLAPTLAFLPTTGRSAVVRAIFGPVPAADLWRDLKRPETLAFWRLRATHRLLPVAAPRAFGDQFMLYWGDNNPIQDTGEFAGSVTLLLALSGVGVLLPRARRRPQERLLWIVLLGSLALLAQPPGMEHLTSRLPVAGMTAAHKQSRIQVLVAFCLCYLAACQLERWVRGEVRRRTLALASAAVLAAVAAGYLANRNPEWPPGSLLDFRAPWMFWQLAVLAAGAAWLLLGAGSGGGDRPPWPRWPRWPRRLALPPRLAPWAVTAAVAAELLVLFGPANPPNERRLAYPRTPAIRFLQAHLGDDRFAGAADALPANFGLVYGLSDARVDNPSIPLPYQAVTALMDRGGMEPRFTRFSHPLYDFLGVRYVIGRAGVQLPLKRVFAGGDAWVWERPDPLPRLFLPARAQIDRGDWFAWLEDNPDYGLRALVDPNWQVDRPWRARDPDASTLRIDLATAVEVRATAVLAEPRLLAASIYQDGGWRVLAGGKPVPGVRVDHAFVGAWLAGGTQAVDLLYRPAPMILGCLLAALGIAAGIAWWAPPPASAGAPRPVPRRPPAP